MPKKRIYKKGVPGSEYDAYQGKPEQIKRRSERNSLRRSLGLKKGDPREAGHIGENRKGQLSRTRGKAISFKSNRKDQPKRNGSQD